METRVTRPRAGNTRRKAFSMSATKSTRKPGTSSTGEASNGFTEEERAAMGRAPQEIDAIITKSGDWRGETLSRLRGIVLGAGPAVVEEVKWKKPSRPEGVPVWSLGGIVCIGEMLKSAVRLTFPKGAQMKDPKKLFNARLDSSSVRAIDFREGEKIPEAALRALILEAVGLNV
jgi:hypothetical protein